MSLKTFYIKWEAQLKAVNPNYDVAYEVSRDEPILFKDSENVRLSFVTIADTHLVDNDIAEKNLANVFEDVGNSKEKLDAFLIAGDIAEYGRKKEYNRFFSVTDKQTVIPRIFLTMGNHDVRFTYGKNQKIIMDKVNEYLKINTNGKSYYSYDVNGYTFIVLGSEDDGENAYISETQLAWLEDELEKASADNLPIFVVLHQPINLTHGLPDTWGIGEPTEITGGIGVQSAQVEAILQQYKNIFYISGHIHNSVTNTQTATLYGYESVESYGNITSVNLPAYSYKNSLLETEKGLGFVFEAYDDEVVIRTRSFTNGIWLPQYTYTIPLT